MTTATATLLPHHAAMIAASGISPEVAQRRGYRSITDEREYDDLPFAPSQRCVPALLIPGTDPAGNNGRYQIRPDHPRIGSNGRALKYESAAGSGIWLDAHPAIQPLLSDPSVPLWLTEGCRKEDAAISAGLCCISIQGVWSWRCLNDWAAIALKGRTIYICFDSDVTSKAEVKEAMTALSAFLTSLGAKVRIVTLPSGPNGEKAGLDDFLAAGHTVQDLEALAGPVVRPYHEPEESEAEQLRTHNDILRRQNEALQRENSAIRTEYGLIRKALANPEVREEVSTALATIDYVAERQAKHKEVGGRVRVFMEDIAAAAGVSAPTAGRHIKRVAAMGVFDRTEIHIPGGLKDRNGRWDKKPKDEVWIELDGKESGYARLARAEPVEDAPTTEDGRRRNHGGVRVRCHRCGGDNIIYRPYCRTCKAPAAPDPDDPTVIQDEMRWADVTDARDPAATANQLDQPKHVDMGVQVESRSVPIQSDLFQSTVNQLDPRSNGPSRAFRAVADPRPVSPLKPPQELIDDLLAIVDDEPPPDPSPTAIQVETRPVVAEPDPPVTVNQVDPRCARCGRSPVVPYHQKCQDCCITDAIKPKAGGMV